MALGQVLLSTPEPLGALTLKPTDGGQRGHANPDNWDYHSKLICGEAEAGTQETEPPDLVLLWV